MARDYETIPLEVKISRAQKSQDDGKARIGFLDSSGSR